MTAKFLRGLLVCTTLLLVMPTPVAADDKRVLFVGNSFSFYSNGIHNHFANLLRADGSWQAGEHRVRLLTLSGGYIHETGRLLNSYLSSGDDDWDIVVLQGHSTEPVSKDKSKRFELVMERMISSLKERKIRPVLFMTWGYQGDAGMGASLQRAYEKVGKANDTLVVPVGAAFAVASQQHPDINLFVPDVRGVSSNHDDAELTYRRDVKHPSVAGTYLAACVMYASLHQRSPEGNLFQADLDPQTALKLQQLSWQVVSDYYQLTALENTAG
jgi:hypothetical protein